MSTQYRLVQSGKTASGGCSAGQGSSEPVAPRIIIIMPSTMFLGTYAVPSTFLVYLMTPNVVVEWLTLLLRIREISGSTLGYAD
jgi:carbohydrate-binding DOMON domain-containing protein